MYQLNIVTQSVSDVDFARFYVHSFMHSLSLKPQNYSVGRFVLKLVTCNLYSLNYSRVENCPDINN